jgi:hypothetical protein
MTIATPDACARPRPVGRRLLRELDRVERLLDDLRAAALERWGSGALEAIDLPPILGPSGQVSPAQLRAAGALLWASQVEEAGLLEFVDALAEGVLEGKVLLPIRAGADRLMLYRRSRTERFAPEERRALYHRLFGARGDSGHPFAAPFGRLLAALDALAHLAPQQSPTALAVRANQAASEVITWLSEEGGGVLPFAARSIADQIKQELAVIRDPDVSRALGGGSPWRMIRLHAQELLGRPLDPEPGLERATAALQLTGWLADAAAALSSGSAALPPPYALQAAELWLSAEPRG